MRISGRGHIECATLVLNLPPDVVRNARQTHPYLTEGLVTEVEKYLGIELEGAERVLVQEHFEHDGVTLIIQADWAPPTRR